MNKRWIISFGGVGLLPAMPGTFGSLAAALLFYLLWQLFGEASRSMLLALLLIVGGIAVWLGPWAEEHFKTADPRQFVLDEIVGQWLTLLFVPLSQHALPSIAAGFFLFRAFDIAKPFPIGRIEKLPGGWGIVLDDAAAAAYAVGGFWVLQYVVTRALSAG